ncbi:MAG: hypothetical protein ACOZF0_03390 [Thermodesulfobacteriota bacterium]
MDILQSIPKRYRAAAVVIMIAAMVFSPGRASAHRVTVFAWIEGKTVHTESKFSGGRAPKDSLVEVFDLQDHKLLEGRTDENGAFSFTPPEWKAMKIVLTAGQGHRGDWTFTEQDLQAEGVLHTPASVPASPAEPPSAISENADSGSGGAGDKESIEAIVERALDKKMAPLLRELKKLEQAGSEPRFRDVMGGIGYILGIVGVAAYFRSRRKAG